MQSAAPHFHLAWSHPLSARPRGLSLAREKGLLLSWDEAHWLYLHDSHGKRQAQVQAGGDLVAACASDDGTGVVAVGSKGGSVVA